MNVLPLPVDRFFAAKNARDFGAAASAFSATGVVVDDGGQHDGRAAIEEWVEETTTRYDDRVEVTSAKSDGKVTEVMADVSGSFSGSPLSLRFRFTLDDDQIDRLEIR
ncbi:MAG: hypothetical protein CMJ31_05855 [Phycisphaerae bacterium]|nr:hypothetical protein [Phycisphaerae bacterium]